MTLLFRAGLVATILLAGSPAVAHHGWGGQEEAVTTLSGTVVQGVSLAGPHATMKIKVGNDVWDLTLAPPARGSASRVVLLHDRPGLREEHPDAYLACADYDRGHVGIARAAQEKVHQVIAIDKDFLEVIPAFADTAELVPERLDLSDILALK